MVRKGRQVGLENSATMRCPPGFTTRSICARAFSVFWVLRRPKEMVAVSNSPSAKGRFRASALVKARWGRALRPAASIPSLKSAGMTSAPAAASGSELEPVPAAKSRIFIPGRGAMIFVVALRQALVRPRLKRSLTRS